MGLIHKHLQSLRIGKRCKDHANAACNRNRGRLRELTRNARSNKRGCSYASRSDVGSSRIEIQAISHIPLTCQRF